MRLSAAALRRMSDPRRWQPDDPREPNCMPDDLGGVAEVKQAWGDGTVMVRFLGSFTVSAFRESDLRRVR